MVADVAIGLNLEQEVRVLAVDLQGQIVLRATKLSLFTHSQVGPGQRIHRVKTSHKVLYLMLLKARWTSSARPRFIWTNARHGCIECRVIRPTNFVE